MKRHQHGINLDDGAELASSEDFNQLYIPVRDEEEIRLSRWLIDPNASVVSHKRLELFFFFLRERSVVQPG